MPEKQNPVHQVSISPGRSQLMARIPGRDTSPERILRKALWTAGLRYRVNLPTSAGRPDIVFRRERVAVFVDGCFWHGCPDHYVRPRSRCDFWAQKLRTNFERDYRQSQLLERDGWRVYRVWEHEIFESLPSVVLKIHRMLAERSSAAPASWRVMRVDVVDEATDLEKQFLRKLRNSEEEKIVTRRRTTAKWRRPS